MRLIADDIAIATRYFTTLVSLYRGTKDVSMLMQRVMRLRDPRNLVNVINAFSMLRVVAPAELLILLDNRFDAEALRELDGHYLCDLAYSLHAQGDPPTTELFERIVARATEIGTLTEADCANLSAALAAVGQTLPVGIKKIADAE